MISTNPLRLDRTRTGILQRAFVRDVRSGYERLKEIILAFVGEGDAFGLGTSPHILPYPTPVVAQNALSVHARDLAHETAPRKVERFRAWLRQKTGSTLAGDELIRHYIEEGYKRGASRAYADLRRGKGGAQDAAQRASDTASAFLPGSTAALPYTTPGVSPPILYLSPESSEPVEYARVRMTKGPTVEKVNLLASRTFSEMEDVNIRMATKMSRLLADGLARGVRPDRLAKQMAAEVGFTMSRAQSVVRTELIRAHAEGQLDALQDLGETETTAAVEFSTGANPCPKCKALDGKIFQIDKARGVIPVHPYCMCAWLPVRKIMKGRVTS